ncbi:PREDICTED: ribonuclease P protein subunit p40 [Condylura cristata]|uniref:ribonuclease P protein subunit p40 n=1 Tax=Condylura cristata TaxID=143302 RepID=UPI000642CC58|nr:PREDICTED: ribonuclease P protein subunit p40 [Condylura cristata]
MATLRRLRSAPRHLLVCEKSNFAHDKSRHRHVVDTHYHNYRCALSLNTRVDEDSTAALLPGGKLILSLDKDTYEGCGLQGRPSRLSGRAAPKYVVSIDLLELAAQPGSKTAQRVAWSFTEKPLKFDFLLAWHRPGADASTLPSHFSSYRVREHQPKVSVSTVTDLPCPLLQSGALGGQPEASCSAPEFLQWLGAVFCGADLNNQPSDFVSTCSCPQPSAVAAQACLCTVTGFLLPDRIRLLLDQLCRYFDEPKLAPWVTLSVQGFADSPVSWREQEHGFRTGGEHLYNFVIFSNRDYWLQMAVGAQDECPP